MRTLLVLVCLLLAGCDQTPDDYWDKKTPLNNDQLIRAYKQCADAGLVVWNFDNSRHETVKVSCVKYNRT